MGPSKIGGNRVWLNGKWYYAHLDSFAKGLRAGMHVKAGQIIGYVGNTGDAAGTPPHLHFGYDPKGTQGRNWSNPFRVLSAMKAGRTYDPVHDTPAGAASSTGVPAPETPEAVLPQFGQNLPVRPAGVQAAGLLPPGSNVSTGDFWRTIAEQPGASPESQWYANNASSR
jgi:murein DD-endopeptidase MepM/ murein hydrolase activator NlpD